MVKRIKRLFSEIAYVVISIIFFIFSALFPTQTLASSSSIGIDARPAQYKTAKAFSQTFCEVITTGLSKESALKIASRELYIAILNESLWSNVVIQDEVGLKSYNAKEIITLTSLSINNTCGKELELRSKRKDINIEEYLESRIEEYFHEI